jgi:carbon starvation protein
MSLPLLATVVLVALFLGYRLYGGFVARQYALDDGAPTPATRHDDGVDFVPTRPFYLLGQHFSAIAAAGPIAGPILAAQQFGWLPALVWICVGVVFIGAVQQVNGVVALALLVLASYLLTLGVKALLPTRVLARSSAS